MRILAVDDDPVVLDILAEFLSEKDGYYLDRHSSAESALQALHNTEKEFDCILLDIVLPGMDGIEMCKQLRRVKRFGSVPVLMITGSSEVKLMSQAFAVGATDFIAKPLKRFELQARVNSAGLLNQSLAKANHTLSELTQLTRIRFEEPLHLKGAGLYDILEVENTLLRSETVRFAMTLVNLDIYGLRGIYRSVSPAAFRQCLEAIGEAAALTMRGANVQIAYSGSGCFVAAYLDRGRIDCTALTEEFNAKLTESWESERTSVPLPPSGRFSQISCQRIWSGTSASRTLREFLEERKGGRHFAPDEENDLFSRLNHELEKTSR